MCEWGNTVIVEINSVPRDIDKCIEPLVRVLNDSGFTTIASCCGHGKQPGNIVLEDKRELFIAPNYKTAREVCKAFPPIN